MNNNLYTLRVDLILVPVGDRHVLIDPLGEQVYVLNPAGAQVWRTLQQSGQVAAEPGGAVDQFLAELAVLGFLMATGTTVVDQEEVPPAGDSAERPAIMSRAPLQVAANTCNDPFKTMW